MVEYGGAIEHGPAGQVTGGGGGGIVGGGSTDLFAPVGRFLDGAVHTLSTMSARSSSSSASPSSWACSSSAAPSEPAGRPERDVAMRLLELDGSPSDSTPASSGGKPVWRVPRDKLALIEAAGSSRW